MNTETIHKIKMLQSNYLGLTRMNLFYRIACYRYQTPLSFILLLAFFLFPPQRTHADEVTLKRFFAEAPPAWITIREAYSGKKYKKIGKRKNESDSKGSPTPIILSQNSWETDIERIDSNLRLRTLSLPRMQVDFRSELGIKSPLKPNGKIKKYTVLINTDYKCVIHEGPYPELSNFDGQLELDQRRVYNRGTIPPLCVSGRMIDRHIHEIPNYDPSTKKSTFFAMDADEIRSDSGEKLVVVKLKQGRISSEGKKIVFKMHDSEATFDPSRNWCVTHFKNKYFDEKNESANYSSEQAITYTETLGDFHPIRSYHVKKISDHQRLVQDYIFTPLLDSDLSVADCYLERYGLEKP